MNMLQRLIKRVSLFNLFLGTVLTAPLCGQDLQQLYEKSFQQGKVLTFQEVLSLKKSIAETNISAFVSWGNIAVNSLLGNPRELQTLEADEVKQEIKTLFYWLRKQKYKNLTVEEAFSSAMFGYNLIGVAGILKISMFEFYYFSKDLFRYILFHYKGTSYFHSAQVMLAIYLIFPSNVSTIYYNSTIKRALSESSIQDLADPLIQYTAYVYRGIFYRKLGEPKLAVQALQKAKDMYPQATLHQLIEGYWSIGRDSF